MSKPQALIVDVDGTMAIHTPDIRGHHEYGKVLQDLPNWPVINMITRILAYRSPTMPELIPIHVTGRADQGDGQVRLDTITWINTYTTWEWEYKNLLMRPQWIPGKEDTKNGRDFRPDDVVKKELYHKHIEPYYDVVAAIDDRPRVLRMWNELGICTLAVGTPWVEF